MGNKELLMLAGVCGVEMPMLGDEGNKEVVDHLAANARCASEVLKESRLKNPGDDAKYLINLMVIMSDPERRTKFEAFWNSDHTVLALAGEGYLALPDLSDPVTGERVTARDNIQETLRVVSQYPQSFKTLFFVSRADDEALPVMMPGWVPISSLMGGRGARFDDRAHLGVAAISGNYLSAFGVAGVRECIAEECYPWHYAAPFCVSKEGITWAILGKLTPDFPAQHTRFRSVLNRTGEPHLWPFRDLMHYWRECVGAVGEQNDPIYAYYSGMLAFLQLGMRYAGDTNYDQGYYEQYAQALKQFCDFANLKGPQKGDMDRLEVMVPLVVEWSRLRTEEEMYDYLNSSLNEVDKAFREANGLPL